MLDCYSAVLTNGFIGHTRIRSLKTPKASTPFGFVKEDVHLGKASTRGMSNWPKRSWESSRSRKLNQMRNFNLLSAPRQLGDLVPCVSITIHQ